MVNINLRLCKNYEDGDRSTTDLMTVDVENSSQLKVIAKKAAEKAQSPIEEIILLYCGSVLDLDDTVEDVGLTTNDYVQCLIKKAPESQAVAPLNIIEAQELHLEFSKIIRSKNRNAFFSHMQNPEFSRKMLQMMPGAGQDPNALSLLQDPAVFTCYAKDNLDEFTKFVQERPVVGRLAQEIIKMYHKDSTTWKTESLASINTGHSYTLDSLHEVDDEDDMMMRRGGPSTSSGNRGNASHSLPIITPAQVAAALANVSGESPGIGPSHTPSITVPQNRGGGSQMASIPATPSNTPASLTSNTPNTPSSHTSNTPSASHTPHTPQQQSGGGSSLRPITSEMLNSALESVLGNVGSASSAIPATTPPPTQPPNMEEAVRLMAEMGIPDESLSRQALQMTNGDVQAAVELVFAQMNMFD